MQVCMWDRDHVLACLLVQKSRAIIPVRWQSTRTEGSVCADLNPLRLNCHLRCPQRKKEEEETLIKTHESSCLAQEKGAQKRMYLHLSGGVIVMVCAVNSSSK